MVTYGQLLTASDDLWTTSGPVVREILSVSVIKKLSVRVW